ncbi:transmembrane protein 69 [Alosa pseudoharengus]|uniref:transmembrane protein 69 n=1 Tax=Alosa pseudoharengus TaxID=34774 RepID=UPI003F8C348E
MIIVPREMLSCVLRRCILSGNKPLQLVSRLSACPDRPPCIKGKVLSCGSICRGPEPLRLNSGTLLRIQSFHSSAWMHKRKHPEEPSSRELDLLRYDMKDLKLAPKPALYLGLSGLMPFVAAPLVMGATELYMPEIAFAQVAYGACIVSFLGGVRWGFAIPEGSPAKPDWLNLANSVVPSLIAWVALLFSKDYFTQSAITVIIGLGIALHYDLALLPTYPSWFKALRALLTFVAFFSLLSTIVIKGVFPEKKFLTEK